MAHSTVVALPGDVIHVGSHETRLGPGIAIDRGEEPFTSKPGILKRKGDRSVWIQLIQKRYVPVEGDRVVGVVIKTGRYHRIDIGSSQSAALPELSFEGTTKRNKINLQVGDCVYGRLSGCGPHFEPQMSCMDSNGHANGMGLLPSNGLILNSTLSLCHQLLAKPSCPVLTALERHYKFECVVGVNGRVWISSSSLVNTITIRNCILASQYMNEHSIKTMVDQATLL